MPAPRGCSCGTTRQLQVHVSEIGAAPRGRPERLIASARRIYGDRLDTLFGEPIPVPAENVHVAGHRELGLVSFPTPGHASHHVSYIDEEGTLYAGDACGVRLEGAHHVIPHAPPPDVDLEGWERTFEEILHHQPERLALVHFGVVEGLEEVADHVERARDYLRVWSGRVERGMDEGEFVRCARHDYELAEGEYDDVRGSRWPRRSSSRGRGWSVTGGRSVSPQWPEPAASVLEELEAQVRDLLGPNLRGMYVYGSLAFECYNPARSDVDVLVVTRRRMAPETRRALSSVLRRLEEVARLEISFLSRADLEPWRYPTPFDYHFSGSSEVHDRAGVYFATEVANARARSFALVGPPAGGRLPRGAGRGLPRLGRARPRLGARPHPGTARICGPERVPRRRLPARAER